MITSWSPSRLAKWESCPRRAKYEIVQKLCPTCFGGTLVGWEPQICDTCAAEVPVPEPLARGTWMHKQAEDFIKGTGKLHAALVNVKKMIKAMREEYRRGNLTIEEDLCFDAKWGPVSKYTKGAWLRTKLDILSIDGDVAEVVDWKSGGIDRKTKEIKAQDKYPDQLNVYATAVLAAKPGVKKVISTLVFLDAPEGSNEVTVGGTAERKDLPKLQKKWEGRIRGMMNDKLFAPRPSNECRWCPFSKSQGGPCQF